jgi:hypothetical protein
MQLVTTWSGGVDTTGVVAQGLARGWDVTAISIKLPYGDLFVQREANAREALRPHLEALGGKLTCFTEDGDWLLKFSYDGFEIPHRNKRMMDFLIEKYCRAQGIRNIGMGEYIGCDTWLVQDHVPMLDCDARSLASYLYTQYGVNWRLWTMTDFAECRYKDKRLKIGYDLLGDEMRLTTQCLKDQLIQCGVCYKCVERGAAFEALGVPDNTEYEVHPKEHPEFGSYLKQMAGEDITISWDKFPVGIKGSIRDVS